MPAVNTGRTRPEATPGQWISGSQDDPIVTPDIPPLWEEPEPPLLNTQPQPLDPQPPTSAFGGQTITMNPNDRNPVTGAPVWNASMPPGPLPPGRASIQPNDTMPVTGAPIWMPPPQGTMASPLQVPPQPPLVVQNNPTPLPNERLSRPTE